MDQTRLSLKGKKCFITGATGGIGECIAFQLVENDCNLFLTATNADKLKDLQNRLQQISTGDSVITYGSADLNKIDDIQAIVDEAKAKLGSVDILINCAGIFPVKSLGDSSLEDFEVCFNINVRAPFLLSKLLSADMVMNRWGRIVNIGSSSAYSGFKETSIYCASKHALLGLSRSLQDELKKYNVRTFCISPGSVKTKMGMKVKNQNFETFIKPQEIAEYVCFVLSFDGGMISEELRLNRMVIE